MSTPTSSNNISAHASSAVKIQIGREETVSDQGRRAEPANCGGSTCPDGSPHAGMGVTSQVGDIGHEIKGAYGVKTVEGSYPGDHRPVHGDFASAAIDKIKNPPHPREQMRGQQNSRNYNEDGKGFVSNMFTTGEQAGS